MGNPKIDFNVASCMSLQSNDEISCSSTSSGSNYNDAFLQTEVKLLNRKTKKSVLDTWNQKSIPPDSNVHAVTETTNEIEIHPNKKTKSVDWTDGYYFDSYAHHQIHEIMLKDRVRTLTYRDAICNNRHLFQGKTVLDIGCGTGILSMFAAKAGAAKVVGIDMSDIAKYARQIVKDNNLDSVITIIQGKVEEIDLPYGIEKVDIIISEWMGYCLLLESMLETVLYARDKWLKFNGMIFPDKVSLWVAGVHDKAGKSGKKEYWADFEGFNMSSFAHNVLQKGHVCQVNSNQVMTSHYELLEFDLKTVYKEELCFQVPFSLEVQRNFTIDALVTFFTVNFSRCLKKTGFSTSPDSPKTHWHQTVFYLRSFAHVEKGEIIKGTFRLQKHPLNHRGLDIGIDFVFDGRLSKLNESNRYVLL